MLAECPRILRKVGGLALPVWAFLVAVSLPIAAAAQYVEVVKLVPADLGGTDFFGERLAISGDRLAVASDEWNSDTGAVYIYERREGGSNAWGLTAKLLDPSPQRGEQFGYSVDLDGYTLSVVSAFGNQPGIRVFELASRGTWELTADRNDRVYASTAINDDTIVGANSSEDRVDVFERDAGGPSGWGLVAALRPSDGAASQFAHNVAIDGDIVVAGAFDDDAGSAYVWERDEEGNWQEFDVAKLLASDGAEDDEFGRSVAVEGDLIAVGAGFADAPLLNTGAAYLYRRNEAGGWPEIAKLVADDADRGDTAGYSAVAISQGRVIVGADSRGVGKLRAVGAAFVFEEDDNGAWHHTATLRSSDEEENDHFGGWVDSSGDTIAVSAPFDGYPVSKGAAYVLEPIASPAIQLSGTCPGVVTFNVSGATPGGAVAIAGAASEGLTDPPGDVCPDVELGLEQPRLLRRLVVDSDGRAEFTGPVSPEFCGWFLQAVDAVTCGVGGISQLP